MKIRPAIESDAEAIAAIYAPVVSKTAISFELEAPKPAVMRQRILETLPQFPWLVCEREGAVIGYAYASRHRERAAYQWSVDVSVYVDQTARRLGVGRSLYTSLFAILKRQGFRNAYAGIALPNPASVGLHESFGFGRVGIYEKVGFKLGSWHDVGWWHITLQDLLVEPPTPVAFSKLYNDSKYRNALIKGE